MVKAQKIIGRKALTLGVFLSIGILGGIAKADTDPFADSGAQDVGRARELAVANAKANTAAVARAEEIKKELEQNPGNAAAARDLQQTNRGIDQRSQQSYGDADRFQGDREMQHLATNVANTAKDWPHMQAYADRWASLAKPDSPEWAKAVNTGGLAALNTGDFKNAEAAARRVLDKFPKDEAARGLLHSAEGRVRAGTATAAPPATPTATLMPAVAPAAAPVARVPMTDPRVRAIEGHLNDSTQAMRMGDYELALKQAEKAASINPNEGHAYMQQALALAALQRLGQALSILDKAIEKFKEGGKKEELPGAYSLSAAYRNQNGEPKKAKEAANEALKYNPNLASAYLHRGQAEVALGEVKEGLADLKIAAGLDARFQTIYEDAAAEAGLPKKTPATEGTFHKAWTTLRGKAGGSFTLFMGAMGAVSFLIAGGVFLFAKEGSAVDRFKTRWFTPSGGAQTAGRNGQDDVIGKTVGGHIEIQSVRDRGGMGVIYEGFDRNLKRPVALKRLLPELQSEDLLKRILAEAQTLALFHHPHIVEIYEVIMESGGIFLVQPLLDGHTVYVELNETPGRRLTTERVLEIVRAVAGAIDYSHAKGVIHRDLKPSNIMVTKDGRILVMDYGIAKSDANNSHLTKTGSSVGTPPYMAPEQEMGKAVKQSDVFALAASTYEMFSGKLPFGMNDLFRKLQKEPGRFAALSSLVPGLSPAVDAVFERGLAAEPGDRQKTCTEFFEELEVACRQLTPPRA